MFKWLQRHFIPHKGNNHRPHFLHAENTRQIVGAVLLFELLLFVLPALNFSGFLNTLNLSSVLPGTLSALTNEEREKNSLPDLVENPLLDQVAQRKAEDMAAKGYFAHTSPEGKSPWYWFDQVGYKYTYAGENLAINFIDSKDVTEAWMNSPTHRANIVASGYTEVGTGIATGMYEGHETIFVAQVYGTPALRVPPVPPAEQINQTSLPSLERMRSNPRSSDLSVLPPSEIQLSNVLGESVPQVKLSLPKSPNLWQKILSSPRQTTNAVLYTVLSLILLALFLTIAVKIEHQHADLITNGLVVAAIIFALHLTNGYFSKSHFEVSFAAFEAPATANMALE